MSAKWFLFPLVYVYLLLLSLFTWIHIQWPDVLVHTTIGLVTGLAIKYLSNSERILPVNFTKNHHVMILYFIELLLVPVAFFCVDDFIEENGFPDGILLSLLLIVLWFITIYIVNYLHENLTKKDIRNKAHYQKTYLFWTLSLMPFYFVMPVPTNNIVKGLVGLSIVLASLLFYKGLCKSKS